MSVIIALSVYDADIIRLQMAEHLRKSEAEVNELLAAYWTLRRETGMKMTSHRYKILTLT